MSRGRDQVASGRAVAKEVFQRAGGILCELKQERERQALVRPARRYGRERLLREARHPVPRDGSLFGWVHQEAVTTLISVQAEYTPEESPVPSWAAMPLAGSSAVEWPPFTRNPIFWGPGSGEYHRTGAIVSLDSFIAGTSDLVFWVDTRDTLGSGCYAVTQDIKGTEGYTLRRGRYVYYEVQLRATPVPSLGKLLASPGKTDLGPRFQSPGRSGNGPPDEAALTGLAV